MSAPQSRVFAWAFALACTTSNASAQTADPRGQPQAPCQEPHLASDYRHDGFFARAQVGLVLYSAHVEDSLGGHARSQIRAYGQSSELSVGATAAPGAVVGISVVAARLDPTFVENGVKISPDDDSVKVTLVRIGPFLDWYPNPARGFHAQVATSLALQVESDEKGNPIEPGAVGAALAVGLGYEWFVSAEFSIGFVVRIGAGLATRAEHGLRERSLWEAPEIGLSYTYH